MKTDSQIKISEQATKLLFRTRIYQMAFWAAVDMICELEGEKSPTELGSKIYRASEDKVLTSANIQPVIPEWIKSIIALEHKLGG